MKPIVFRVAVAFLAALLPCLLAGCAAKAPQSIDLSSDPLHIEVDPEGRLPPRFWDSYLLMQRAEALFSQKRFAEALTLYRKIADQFPKSDLYPIALFNAGLCLEELGKYDQALEVFRTLEKKRGPTIELKELRFRQAGCLEELGRQQEAAAVLAKISDMFSITAIERINATIRLGVAHYKAGDPRRAKAELRRGLDLYRGFAKKQLPIDTYFVAMGYFYLGEIYFDAFENTALKGKGQELANRLETKADFLVLARAQYLRCMRTYQGKWMSASLHKLGLGYETFFFALENFPAPEELNEMLAREYKARLNERIKNVFFKAIDAYERNVNLDRELDLASEWAEKSRKRLEALRGYQKEMGL